jgi:hypothetical protein
MGAQIRVLVQLRASSFSDQVRDARPTTRGEDVAVLLARDGLYQQAKAARPERWRGPTRDWSRPGVVWLNPAPDRPKETETAV